MVPEMIVLSKFLRARCACVHVHACMLMQMSIGRVGLQMPSGIVGWAATTTASVWVAQSLKIYTWWNSWLWGGWALQ